MGSELNKSLFFFHAPSRRLRPLFLSYFWYRDSRGAHDRPRVLSSAIMNSQAVKSEEQIRAEITADAAKPLDGNWTRPHKCCNVSGGRRADGVEVLSGRCVPHCAPCMCSCVYTRPLCGERAVRREGALPVCSQRAGAASSSEGQTPQTGRFSSSPPPPPPPPLHYILPSNPTGSTASRGRGDL